MGNVLVVIEQRENVIQTVSLELLGKATEIAKDYDTKVSALLLGSKVEGLIDTLAHYGADEVIVVDDEALAVYTTEPYTKAAYEAIKAADPIVVLFGATSIGRDLAPRVSARIHTGLTADCTGLAVAEDTKLLLMTRPAFGGNIMAHINTPNNRPQFATVRYKIFSAPEKIENTTGKITLCKVEKKELKSKIKVLSVKEKNKEVGLEEAEVIVVASRAIKKQEDMEMIYKLADKLNAQVAGTRPVIEAGWIDAKKQIGLSGRTVKPKLIITCGVSGAVQFVAGMQGADYIVAINKDDKAPILDVAHLALIGDIYDIIPKLIEKIENNKDNNQKYMASAAK